jgi:Putative Ig domain
MVKARRFLLVLALGAAIVAVVASVAAALDAEGERLPDAIVGVPYEGELEASGGCIPYTFKLSSGYLPPGLKVDPTPTRTTGTLSGTPTASGWFDWYLEVTDICGSKPSQEVWTIFIHPALVIKTESLPRATPGAPYSTKLTADSGDTMVLQWSLGGGALPAGLVLARDGTISGTTSAVGSYTIVAKVHDGNIRTTTKELTLVVGAQLQASAPALPRGEAGVGYSGRLSATGGAPPLRWSVAEGTLPAGLALNAATGAITGRPAVGGVYKPNFTVTDATGAKDSTTGTLQIAARLRITTTALPAASLGNAYRTRVATGGGTRPVAWSVSRGSLPPGVRLGRLTGALTGAPSQAGTFRFSLTARDPLGGSSTKLFRLVVR